MTAVNSKDETSRGKLLYLPLFLSNLSQIESHIWLKFLGVFMLHKHNNSALSQSAFVGIIKKMT